MKTFWKRARYLDPFLCSPIPFFTIGCLGIVYLVWGSTYLAIRYALDSLPPFLLAGSRYLTAGTLMFVFSLLRGSRWPTFRQWRDGGIIGVLLLTIGNGGVVVAEISVASGVAALVVGTSPLAATLWAGAFGEWPQKTQWIAIILGILGTVVLLLGTPLRANPQSFLCLMAAVAAWTLGSVLARTHLRVAPGAMGFATEMVTGGVTLIAISGLFGERFPAHISAVSAIAWLYLVLAGTLLAFSAYMYLVASTTTDLTMSYAYVAYSGDGDR